jgi:hypothetical protein
VPAALRKQLRRISRRPGARRVVNFKGEDEVEGDEAGPVFITDEDDPAFLQEIGCMKISDARELARGLGHPFSAD